jgi:type I restriction enzyme S subunit
MRKNYKRIGDYISPVKVKNTDLKAKELLGINIDKFFMPSVANVVGTDLSRYKVVETNQFACNRMHVGRDYRIPIALSDREEPFMVSPAYDVFEIINPKELLPEYLMMWFSRKEFDRNAWYHTDSDVRGGLPWDAFVNLKLPIPHPDKQRQIVAEYNSIQNRIQLNKQLIQKLEEAAQAIYKQWFVNFNFPDENGNPYKSSGGKMVYNEELEKEIPEAWELIKLSQIIDVVNGFAFKSNDFSEKGSIPIIKIANITPPTVEIQNAQYYSKVDYSDLTRFVVEKDDILISMTGSHMNQINSAVGKVGRHYFDDISLLNQRVGKLKPKINCSEFLFLFMNQQESQKHLLMGATGSANQANISPGLIKSIKLPLPPQELLDDFEIKISTINNYRIIKYIDNTVSYNVATLLHSKLATIEN